MENSSQNNLLEFSKIRHIWHNGEWRFAIEDIIEMLTEAKNIKRYIELLQIRDPYLAANWGTICTPLQILAVDDEKQTIQTANTEGVFRIIGGIPSPKGEYFRMWLVSFGDKENGLTDK